MPPTAEIERAAQRRATILDLIRESVTGRGYPPTIRELCAATGVTTRTIRVDLERLVEVGAIEVDRGEARGIRLRDS